MGTASHEFKGLLTAKMYGSDDPAMHPALSLTPLEMEELIKKYEHCGISPEDYARLRELVGMPQLIEGEVIE